MATAATIKGQRLLIFSRRRCRKRSYSDCADRPGLLISALDVSSPRTDVLNQVAADSTFERRSNIFDNRTVSQNAKGPAAGGRPAYRPCPAPPRHPGRPPSRYETGVTYSMRAPARFRTPGGGMRLGSTIDTLIQGITEFDHAVESFYLPPVRRDSRQPVSRSGERSRHGGDGVGVASDPDGPANRVVEIGGYREAVEGGEYRTVGR